MKIQDIKVKTVETKKLIEFLNVKLNEDETLHIDRFAIYDKLFEIDTDCCFGELTTQHFNDEIQPVIEIACRIKKRTETGYTIRTDKPDFYKIISVKDYENMATEVMLVDFIRFNYNPRIESNQRLLMKHINQ
jgi:hypothetical protein